jgi:hypothetical protein
VGTTAKGIPFPDLSNSPNGPDQIAALAEWLDTMLSGSTGQVLTADLATTSDVKWAWPQGRVVASVASIVGPTQGQIAIQTGAPAGLYYHTGGGWVRLAQADVVPAAIPLGIRATSTQASISGVSDTVLCELNDVPMTAGRRYLVRARAEIWTTEVGNFVMAGCELQRDGGFLASGPRTSLLTTPETNVNTNRDTLTTWAPVVGSGGTADFGLRVFKQLGTATLFHVNSATLEVVDDGVGP